MKRAQYYAAAIVTVALSWLYLMINRTSDNLSLDSRQQWIITVFPWLLLMTFGCYCLFKLGYDLLTFNDYPKEIGKLAEVAKFYFFR